jgi:hypothetical protein
LTGQSWRGGTQRLLDILSQLGFLLEGKPTPPCAAAWQGVLAQRESLH